jgi:hypothetical protein
VKPNFTKKTGLLNDLLFNYANKRLTHGERNLFSYFLTRADNRGIIWESQDVLTERAGTSDKGIVKMTRGLKKAGCLQIGEFKTGDRLPSGRIANCARLAYFISTKYFTPLRKAGQASRESRAIFEKIALGVEQCSMPTNGRGVEQRSTEHGSGERQNSVPKLGEQSSSALHDKTITNKKEQLAQEIPAYLKRNNRIFELAKKIENDEPISPEYLRRVISEAVEDKVRLPKIVQDSIQLLLNRRLLTRLPTGKIDFIDWEESKRISELRKSRNPVTGYPEEFDELVQQTQASMSIDYNENETSADIAERQLNFDIKN